jgi:pimeloyl-[acyl-carrier protein] synthase
MHVAQLARGALRRLRSFAAGAQEPSTVTSATISFDDPRFSKDPFHWYEVLRAEGGVLFLPRHASWIVLNYPTARAILMDPEQFSSAPFGFIDPVMLGADPPGHGAIRRVVSRRFNGDVLRNLEAGACEHAAALLAPEIDVVRDFARPISRRTAAALIGFEGEALRTLEGAEDEVAEQRPQAFNRLLETLDELAWRSVAFRQFAAEGADRISEAEARSIVRLLWVASTATTERTIAQAAFRLIQDPTLQIRLREAPGEIPQFVDEVIRLAPPELFLRRQARRDAVLEGVKIASGAQILISLGAANRDPSVYSDPTRFQLGRSPPSLGFGAGIHSCVGGPLSRRIVAAAVQTLLACTDRMTSAEDMSAISMLHAMEVFTPRTLPLTLELAK